MELLLDHATPLPSCSDLYIAGGSAGVSTAAIPKVHAVVLVMCQRVGPDDLGGFVHSGEQKLQ